MTGNEIILLLPDPPPAAFACAVEVLKELSEGRINEADLRFGGTALALLWNHRQSTDLDIVIDHGVFDRIFPSNDLQAANSRLKEIRDRLINQTVAITVPSVGWHNVSFRSGGIPVSFARSRLSNRRHDDIVLPFHSAHSAIHLVPPSFILQGKIQSRLIESQSPVDRDGYDIAYAMKYHKDCFTKAIECVFTGSFLIWHQPWSELQGSGDQF